LTISSRKWLLVLAGSILLIPMMVGCKGDSAPLTQQEKSDFKGGPMPESARQIMQQKMKEAADKAPKNSTAPPDAGKVQ